MMNHLYTIALTFIKGIGPIGAKTLLAQFVDAENIFKEPIGNLLKMPRVGVFVPNQAIRDEALRRAEQEMEFAERNKVKIHYYKDSSYSRLLKDCPDSPIILYQYGDTDLNMGYFMAVVGTRNATAYGKEQTTKLVEKTSALKSKVCVISGLAYGIDSIAHRIAIKENRETIAVVAHGLDRIYPAQHRSLAERIIARGGSIVTEYPSETNPDAPNFVQRNRIIAGMSNATVIVESAEKGGALLTANAANVYNRDVFAFAGRTDDIFSQGCNKLIKTNQAQLITSADDIIETMGWENGGRAYSPELFVELTEDEKKIVEILNNNPSDVNDLSRITSIPIQKLVSILVLLEFKGVVQALPGNIYKI